MFGTISQAQDASGLDFPAAENPAAEDMYQVANCTFFGPGRGRFKFQLQPDSPFLNLSGKHPNGELTQQVMRVVGPSVTQSNYAPDASRNHASQDIQSFGTIDKYIFGALQDAGVQPANPTTDAEFIRRVTRKLVRRLWSEEIHDSIAMSSNMILTYTISDLGTVTWAIQFPETNNMPTAGNRVTPFLDAFLRGNRDDQPRPRDGSIWQPLGLVNDPFVMSRVQAAGSSLLANDIGLPDSQMISNLFMAILSRNQTSDEMATALKDLQSGTHSTEAVNLVWQLYNKVDFMFNY
jgi:hypothetical protein